jgi:simple sugar transport system permease protein
MRFEARKKIPLLVLLFTPITAVFIALVLCSGLIVASGASVIEAYTLVVKGSLGSMFALSETFARATPLILTGLAAATAFRAKLWNIGMEGQLYAGALITSVMGGGILSVITASWVLIPILMFVGAVAGAMLMLGPAWLKIRFNIDEVVVTLLLNFIVLLFVSMMIEGPMRDPLGFGWPQSAPVVDEAVLPKLVARTRLHSGLLIGLGAAVLLWFMNARATWGYEFKAVGINSLASHFAGLPVKWIMLRAGIISGMLAGLAGTCEVLGLKGYMTLDISPGYGYTGIIVAMLGQLHPIGVVVSAVFVAGVFVGADAMGRTLGVPSYIADIVVAVSLLCVLIGMFLAQYRVRR